MNTNMSVNSTSALVPADLNKVPNETAKSSGLCTRLACSMVNSIEHFSLGAVAAAAITPLANSVS